MLKKTITYIDFNDEKQTEDFYFHMSEAELAELELTADGGLKSWLERIIAREDGEEMVAMFKKIILGAYGKKSLDGKRFLKTQEIRDDFVSSPAYSVLFMELITDVSAMVGFVNGMVPRDLARNAEKMKRAGLTAVPDADSTDKDIERPEIEVPNADPTDKDIERPEFEGRIVTEAEVEEMGPEDLRDLYRQIARGEAKIEEKTPFS